MGVIWRKYFGAFGYKGKPLYINKGLNVLFVAVTNLIGWVKNTEDIKYEWKSIKKNVVF